MNEIYDTRNSKNILVHPGEDADNKPGLHINQDSTVIYSPEGTSTVSVNRDDGVVIGGPLSILTSPDQWRVAGLWKVNPLIMSSLPSTIYTPVPWMRQSVPRPPKALIEGIVGIATLMTGLG